MLEPQTATSETASENAATVPSVNLDAPGVAKALSKKIADAIDKYCAEAYDDGPRKHLGASLIGDACKRKLWYGFRWVLHFKHSGRQQRLFNRGHREEERFIEWLEGIGFKIWYEDRSGLMYHPESDSYWLQSHENDEGDGLSYQVTRDSEGYREHIAKAKFQGIKFKQYRISGVNGHFGGSLDGIAEFPPGWGIDEPVLLEFKTNGTGSKFDKLCATGMAINKPLHFAQTSTYGSDPNYRFRFVLYLNINKNDDSMHVELVALNWQLGDQMRAKAEQVIASQRPPARLSENRNHFECKYCDFFGVCHDNQAAEVNCRSCIYAVPAEHGAWLCTHDAHKDSGPIPDEVIKTGCRSYYDITLEPGTANVV